MQARSVYLNGPVSRYRAAALALLLWLLLPACSELQTVTPEQTAAPRPAPTQMVIPTLYPTVTRAQQMATPTREMPATRAPESTADLQQMVVELRYTIPALGLDRRLEGNVAGTITVVDEAAGLAATLAHQGGVLFELQSALPELELAPLPEGCDGCVAFSYTLPLSGEEDSGWLRDAVMLASVENYLALTLGPHWPAGTVAGLRRSASPYHVAQTVAVTDDGEVYRWRATSPQVDRPAPAGLPPLPDPEADLAAEYSVTCPGAPLETLLIRRDGEETSVSIACPAFSLPATLVPLYTALDALLAPLLDEEPLAVPPPEIPLDSMVLYEKSGSGRMILRAGDQMEVTSSLRDVVSRTVAAGTVISITAALEESGALRPGVAAYTAAQAPHVLLVRTARGMAEATWETNPPAALAPVVEQLEVMWEDTLPEIGPAATSTGTPAAATPHPTATP